MVDHFWSNLQLKTGKKIINSYKKSSFLWSPITHVWKKQTLTSAEYIYEYHQTETKHFSLLFVFLFLKRELFDVLNFSFSVLKCAVNWTVCCGVTLNLFDVKILQKSLYIPGELGTHFGAVKIKTSRIFFI